MRVLTRSAAAAGLAAATLAAPALAQDTAPTPEPSPSPSPSPSPAPIVPNADEDLGTFEVDLPAGAARPRPIASHPQPTRAHARPTPAPTATPSPAPVGGERHGSAPDADWQAQPAARISAAALGAFRIPPFLLPIYQAAGIQYGVRWEVLAAINEVETDDGRNLDVSSAGALGWMQFMPASWRTWGVDANRDGLRDPYNPVDAVFAAARYLKAAGAGDDIRRAVFAYNHADWYVDDVLARAREISALPTPLVSALTGLAQGRLPVAGRFTFPSAKERRSHRGIELRTRRGTRAIAVSDGRVVRVSHTSLTVQDAYGNLFTYSGLDRVAATYPVPRSRRPVKLRAPKADPRPQAPASRTAKTHPAAPAKTHATAAPAAPGAAAAPAASARPQKNRLFAHPARRASRTHGGTVQLAEAAYRPEKDAVLKLNRRDYRARPMHRGARVLAGTVLGRTGRGPLVFEIRPAGKGAPRIDPKPILQGWKLLGSTAAYQADAALPSVGQALLLSKDALQRQVLSDPRLSVYACGRHDIAVGAIDRRVLATLEFLAGSGLDPTVTALRCGHSYLTASGNVSEHSSGNAVDIAALNGIPILGHQGPGSITDRAVRELLTLQGPMAPHQIITLMDYAGEPAAFALPDHDDHIHIGFRPQAAARGGTEGAPALEAGEWPSIVRRLARIRQPVVATRPSRYAVRVKRP